MQGEILLGKKARTTVYLDSEIVDEAQELGLNLSKTCENALKQAIKQLRPLYGKNNPRDCPESPQNEHVVGLPGFEPGSRAPEAQSLDHASRQPLPKSLLKQAPHKHC